MPHCRVLHFIVERAKVKVRFTTPELTRDVDETSSARRSGREAILSQPWAGTSKLSESIYAIKSRQTVESTN